MSCCKFKLFCAFQLLFCAHTYYAEPLTGNETETETNKTDQDILVVKTVVYEVGILTDADDNNTSPESEEDVEWTFFNPNHTGSLLNLGEIPAPIRTNFSGLSFTEFAPINRTDYFPLNVPIVPNLLIGSARNFSTNETEEEEEIIDRLRHDLEDPLYLNSYSDDGSDEE